MTESAQTVYYVMHTNSLRDRFLCIMDMAVKGVTGVECVRDRDTYVGIVYFCELYTLPIKGGALP